MAHRLVAVLRILFMALGRGFEIGDHEGHLRRRQMVSGAEWKNRFQNSTVAEVQAHMKRWGVMGADYSVVDANLATMGPAMATSNFDTSKDTAFFFMIPKSGTTTLGAYLANCVTERLVIANAVGGFVETFPPTSLKVVDHKGNKYVNVDVTTRDGLDWAAEKGIAQSAIADVLISAFPVHVANVFSAEHKAHMFTLIRHPFQRTISEFYYCQVAEWEKESYKPWLKDWTLEQYINSDFYVDNFITRQLVGKTSTRASLDDSDLEFAKHLLSTRCLVGLTIFYPESLRRFEKYFKWESDFACVQNLFANQANVNHHPNELVKDSPDYNALVKKNQWDIELWRHAVQVFDEQGQYFPTDVLQIGE